MRPTRTWGLAFCIITMAACGDETGPSEVTTLVGSWQLESIERDDGTATTIADPDSYTATFSAEGDLAVVADCNRCNGGYVVDGTNVQISTLACTRAFCGPDSFFDEYTMALDSATTFSRNGDELRIRYDKLVFHLKDKDGTSFYTTHVYDGGTLVFRASP
jgi:heat shock protein HslJ